MILELYSQVTYRFGKVIVKHINIRLFDLLGRCHYIHMEKLGKPPVLRG